MTFWLGFLIGMFAGTGATLLAIAFCHGVSDPLGDDIETGWR